MRRRGLHGNMISRGWRQPRYPRTAFPSRAGKKPLQAGAQSDLSVRPEMTQVGQRGPSSGEAAWRKPSLCQQGECAELLQEQGGGEILVRSTRKPDEVVRFTVAEWQALAAGILAGDYSDFG